MSETAPSVVVIAGPNGAGKSTAAPALLGDLLGIADFVNADVIARGLSAFEPERAALAAGRVMLARLKELAAERATFGGLRNIFTLHQPLATRWTFTDNSNNEEPRIVADGGEGMVETVSDAPLWASIREMIR
ncbi:MAG TPA: hypothetical protein VEA69_12530 [Tepidisphaeraceae bacterium]|nr:hypothetical protein [Tepidisphaeraceae bacterium]